MAQNNAFHVLDRNLDLDQHYLLEASAGTGKTFSIENVVVRLIIQTNPIPLKQILVVTFTRAATRDLKSRIRNNLIQSLAYLQCGDKKVPDYLQAIIDEGPHAILAAKKNLEHALFCFDEAQIFTIHSFCSRILKEHLFEGGLSFNAIGDEEQLSLWSQMKVIDDCLRTILKADAYSAVQIKKLLGRFKQSMEEVKRELLKVLGKNLEVESFSAWHSLFDSFKGAMLQLKRPPEKILKDYEQIAKVYKKIKSENNESVHSFAQLFGQAEWSASDFERLIEDGLFWISKCHPDNLRKGQDPSSIKLHDPYFTDKLQKILSPIIDEASDPFKIFARLANDCQKHLKRYLENEELLGFNEILQAMLQASRHPTFAKRVRASFKAAVIDEFQDTDPIQWEIFRNLFPIDDKSWGHLYLVGDPKQSIYSFRQADIYTYLSAAHSLNPQAIKTLDTNFRSRASLVEALNTLFDPSHCPHLIPLPRLSTSLPYEIVKSGASIKNDPFKDGKGAVHFFTVDIDAEKSYSIDEVDQDYFFPFIVQEITSLNKQGFSPKQIAILVGDRRQAARLMEFLKIWKIPATNHRNCPLAETLAYQAYRELLEGILNPHKKSLLKRALGGPILGWTHDKIKRLEELGFIEKVLIKIEQLRFVLNKEGIAAFHTHLMQSSFFEEDLTVAEQMLTREKGEELYEDLLHLTEVLAEEQSRYLASPEKLLAYLDHLEIENEKNEEGITKKRNNPDKDAIQILTIHKSKGLEFDIVFALGLALRGKEEKYLIPIADSEGHYSLKVRRLDSLEDTLYCREQDAERMRQLYVAMTRAKLRLYAPALFGGRKELKPGTASAMELFSARLGQPPFIEDGIYEQIHQNSGNHFHLSLEELEKQASISHVRLQEAFQLEIFEKQEVVSLIPPKKVCVPGCGKSIYSYSALSKSIASETLPHLSQKQFERSESPLLPSNNEVGNLLHKLLEMVDLETVRTAHSPQELIPFTSKYTKNTPYSEWTEMIAQIVYNALSTPFPFPDGLKPIANLKEGSFYREAEFLYPWESDFFISEIEYRSGFLKGVIDLIFEIDGKYYLLDWKSNWLGPTRQAYRQDLLHQAMLENHYFLQAQVYTEALRRFVALYDGRPFDQIFGGIFYIFLRGLDSTTGDDFGVYFFKEMSC
jgi:exodeoxyribonuclease V beta subunit